ncbi:hypothetical protein [Microcoleus vaginatus]|uniref:hypothetical protein n=1 Tax=Microcoleus vaginatus TaxID=119532 RepID=UPI0032A884A0
MYRYYFNLCKGSEKQGTYAGGPMPEALMPQVIKKQQQVQILHLPPRQQFICQQLRRRAEILYLYQKAVVAVTIELQRLIKLWLANLPCLYSPTQKSLF